VSNVEGTSDMPECVRKVLEKHSDHIIVPLADFGSADAAAKLRRDIDRECWLALQVRQPTKIIITDVS
jgi:hypothetical protein